MISGEQPRRSVRHGMLAAALVGTIGLLGAHDPVPVEQPYPVALTAEDKAFVTESFKAGVSHWKEQGVPGIEKVKLTFISGGDWATCYGFPQVTSNSPSSYCPSGNGTVYITAKDYDDGHNNSFRRKLTINHELGHAVHDKRDQIPLIHNTQEELGATCLAGESMRATDTMTVMMALAGGIMNHVDMYNIGDDDIHGSGEGQKTAFNEGFTRQNCDAYTQHPLIHY